MTNEEPTGPSPECKLASSRAGAAWKTYGAKLHEQQAANYAGKWNRDLSVMLNEEISNTRALESTSYTLIEAIADSYEFHEHLDDPSFVLARKTSEEAWTTCRNDAGPTTLPPRMHPQIARLWRRLYAVSRPEHRARVAELDLANTDTQVSLDRLGWRAKDLVVHEAIPLAFEEAGAAQVADQIRQMPRIDGDDADREYRRGKLHELARDITRTWGDDRKDAADLLVRICELDETREVDSIKFSMDALEKIGRFQAAHGKPTDKMFELSLKLLRQLAADSRSSK